MSRAEGGAAERRARAAGQADSAAVGRATSISASGEQPVKSQVMRASRRERAPGSPASGEFALAAVSRHRPSRHFSNKPEYI